MLSHRKSGITALMIVIALALALTPAAGLADNGNQAPEPPSELTVNDRQRALNVEGAPRFGWFPQDRDTGEVQTAYQIEVSDDQGAVVWDSGKVESAEQQYVTYEGPELDRGETYRWRVRTWDSADAASPWADQAEFDTGISDEDWGATWIHGGQDWPWFAPEVWTLARTEVQLRDEEVTRARAYTAASHTYELYLGGERADRGQSFAYPGEHYYQASDVTDLVAGEDELAVGAILHWYGNGQGRPAVEPGLLMRLDIEYADGGTQTVVTDGSWKVTEGPYPFAGRRNGEGELIEHLDATRIIDGWREAGFDDSDWDDATEIGEHPTEPFTALRGQETRLTETRVEPERMLVAEDGTVVADFGKVIPARPAVWFDDGEEGRTIDIRGGYGLAEDGRVDRSQQSTQATDLSFPYTQVDGEQHFQAFTHIGFRYLEVPDAGEEIERDDVSAVVVHTDAPEGRESQFTSSDETLNEVWEMMARSGIYSIQEAFVDTPTREKAQFLGDAIAISYATMPLFTERDATQQAIYEFLDSADRHWSDDENDVGRYNAVYPNGDGKRDIPDYTLRFVDWVSRYYLETGDEDLVEDAYPYLRNTAEYVLRHIPEDGPTADLVTDLSGGGGAYLYGIVDWPTPSRFGYDMDTAVRTTINAESVHVLRLVAELGEELGADAAEVERYEERAEELAAAMNERLRNEDGVYVDGLKDDGSQSEHAGQHASSYPISYRIAPEDDWDVLADHVADMGMRQGPMTVHRLLDGLGNAERPDAVLDLLTNEDDLGWADILAQGGTFTWETWTPQPGSNHSESHGWGAQSAVDIIETLIGLEVTSPGAETIEVAPPDVEDLDEASGTIQTQRGPVTVEWRRHPQGMQAEIDVPVNVTARVALPLIRDDRTYRAAGPSRAEYLGEEDGRAVFEVGSGESRYTPVSRRAAQPGRGR